MQKLLKTTAAILISNYLYLFMIGQFISSTQFYLYGKSNFTKTGYDKARKLYEQPDILSEGSDLKISEYVYMITGANTGVGREIATFLAKRGAGAVYLVCRNAERAEVARSAIVDQTGNSNVFVLQGPFHSYLLHHCIYFDY